MPKPTIHIFSGLPASGKTTLANEIAQTETAVCFSVDEWLMDILNTPHIADSMATPAEKLKERFWQTAVFLIQAGQDVVLDWSLDSSAARKTWIERIEAAGANHKLYFLNVPKPILRQRIHDQRAALTAAPKISLDYFLQQAEQFEPPRPEEGFNLVEMHWQPNQPIHNAHLDGRPFLLEGGPVGVLLIHGLTATAAEVRPMANRLHQLGYTVAGPLLPGHGTKPEEMKDISWHDWAWEVEIHYQHLATICDHVFVGGESTGAVLALELARSHADIQGVLCYAPAIKLALPLSTLIRLYAAAPLVDSIPKSTMGTNELWQGYRVYPLRGIMELVRLGRFTRNKLSEINQPVLIVQGRNDQTIAPESGDIILSGVNSKYKERYWMEKSAHVVLLEDELDQIVTITEQFIQKSLS